MDIKLDSDFNYDIQNGDFVLCDNNRLLNEQNTQLILSIDKGHIRYSPTSGVGIGKLLNGKLTPLIKRNIENELNKVGVTVNTLEIVNNEIKINIL